MHETVRPKYPKALLSQTRIKIIYPSMVVRSYRFGYILKIYHVLEILIFPVHWEFCRKMHKRKMALQIACRLLTRNFVLNSDLLYIPNFVHVNDLPFEYRMYFA